MPCELPYHLIHERILPLCDIDTRLAFRVTPRRMDLTPWRTGAFAESLHVRYGTPQVHKTPGLLTVVPLHTVAGWHERSLGLAKVNLFIHSFHSPSETLINVNRVDYRDDDARDASQDSLVDYFPLTRISRHVASFSL